MTLLQAFKPDNDGGGTTEEFSARTSYGMWVTKDGHRILHNRDFQANWRMIDNTVTRANGAFAEHNLDFCFFEGYTEPNKRVLMAEAVLPAWESVVGSLHCAPCRACPALVRSCVAPVGTAKPEEDLIVAVMRGSWSVASP